MLAISVFQAIKDAVDAASGYRGAAQLNAPATPEEVLRAIDSAKKRTAAA
jgi:xanthine dehydrogenase large subunit